MKVKSIFVGNPSGFRVFLPLVFLFAFSFSDPAGVYAQSADDSAKTEAAAAVQVRIERARALAAAHKLEAAVRELESLRSTAADEVVHNVTSVMLISIYLEEGNYPRAEALLEETFRARAARKDHSIRTYFALAGQAVNGARAHLARYRNFGISVSDSGLPAEALSDLDRLRSLLERMIAQAREITRDDSKAHDSMALLEDVLGIRLTLAREGEDREKWAKEYADARQGLASSQKQVASLEDTPPLSAPEVRSTVPGKATSSAPGPKGETPSPETSQQNTAAGQPGNAGAASDGGADSKTISVGSLNHWATKRVVPLYPQLAKASAVAGVVRVFVTTDAEGRVIDVSHSEGPLVLKQAAESAARQWRFQPAIVANKRFGLAGFIEFNFTL